MESHLVSPFNGPKNTALHNPLYYPPLRSLDYSSCVLGFSDQSESSPCDVIRPGFGSKSKMVFHERRPDGDYIGFYRGFNMGFRV